MATTHLLCRTLQMHVKQPRPDSSLNVSAPSVAEMSSRMVSRCGHSTMRNALVMPRILQRSRVLVSAGNLLHLKPSPMKKERFSASFTSPSLQQLFRFLERTGYSQKIQSPVHRRPWYLILLVTRLQANRLGRHCHRASRTI